MKLVLQLFYLWMLKQYEITYLPSVSRRNYLSRTMTSNRFLASFNGVIHFLLNVQVFVTSNAKATVSQCPLCPQTS